jgi:hypothetical protein
MDAFSWKAILWGMVSGAIGAVAISIALLAIGILQTKWQCWGAPPVVEFHQGMTLCPGQGAELTIPSPFRFERKEPRNDGI